MKRKASLSSQHLPYNDPNQGVLTYAHDGDIRLGVVYNENGQKISNFDEVPPYGIVMVNGKDAEMIIMRLCDGSILCFKSSSGTMKLKDQLEIGRGQRWCHNYSCIHVSQTCGPESSRVFTTEGQNPYNLGRCDSRSHGNIRRYVTNLMKPGESGEVKPECRFIIPIEYGGNGKEGILKFPIKAIHFKHYTYKIGIGILSLRRAFERVIGEQIPEEIYYLIINSNKEIFMID